MLIVERCELYIVTKQRIKERTFYIVMATIMLIIDTNQSVSEKKAVTCLGILTTHLMNPEIIDPGSCRVYVEINIILSKKSSWTLLNVQVFQKCFILDQLKAYHSNHLKGDRYVLKSCKCYHSSTDRSAHLSLALCSRMASFATFGYAF